MAIVWEAPVGRVSLEETATETAWRQLLVQALSAPETGDAVPGEESVQSAAPAALGAVPVD